METLPAAEAGLTTEPQNRSGYRKVSSPLQRGTWHSRPCRGGCQLSSPFLCCHEHPENKQSLWIPVSPAAKLCLAPPSAGLQLVNGLRGMWDPEHVRQRQETPGNGPRSVFMGTLWQLQPHMLVSISRRSPQGCQGVWGPMVGTRAERAELADTGSTETCISAP